MNQKTIILTAILFALIVAGMFVYARLKMAERTPVTTTAAATVFAATATA